jgi:hypothetical protein
MSTDPDTFGCPVHARENPTWNLVGTVCVPNDAVDEDVDDVEYVNFADPNWKCAGRDDKDDGAVAIWIMMNLFFGVGWIPIAAIFCCIFRNKSQNTAPFNGGGVKSFPQAAKAQPVAEMQVVQMQCPEGAVPGQTVQTNVNGQPLNVQIPADVQPGAMFQVRSVGQCVHNRCNRQTAHALLVCVCLRTRAGPGANYATGTRPCAQPSWGTRDCV